MGGFSGLNETQKKKLPAWIRAGLEKMEMDKLKKEQEEERKRRTEEKKRLRRLEEAEEVIFWREEIKLASRYLHLNHVHENISLGCSHEGGQGPGEVKVRRRGERGKRRRGGGGGESGRGKAVPI